MITQITTNEDYQKALERLEQIFDSEFGSDKGDELELLGKLIDEWEQKNYPIK
jgi:HTH-type transcriptional regulator/antitoxin HigA